MVLLLLIIIPVTLGAKTGSITITSQGFILMPQLDYTILSSSGTYTAINSLGQTVASSSDGATVTTIVLGLLTSGQTVEFVGNFSLSSTINIIKSNITLDFGTALLTFSESVENGFLVSNANHVTFLNGEIIGSNYAIVGGYGSSYITVQGCTIHGQTATLTSGAVLITSNNRGYNKIVDCTFYDENQPIFICSSSSHNTITGTVFHDAGVGATGCGIYMDGGGTPLVAGFNEVSGCDFYNWRSNCAIAMKCGNNAIHSNNFWNFTALSVCTSTYSAYPTSHADDNTFYNNTFTDCVYGLWFGGNSGYPAGQAQPVLRSLIYNNVFTRVTKPIELNNWWAGSSVDDTKVYYNNFISCASGIYVESGSSNVHNTAVAYNDFSQSAINTAFETSYTNTMVTGNIGLTDYHPVTDPSSPYYIPPP